MKQGLRRILGGVTALAAGFTLAGCANSDTDATAASTVDVSGNIAGTASVFAAASLTNVAEELAGVFTAENPQAEIVFNFAGSSALVRQMGEGAPSDLFISADVATMDTALELAEFGGSDTVVIASNRLVLVTADGNPGEISELADVTDSLVAICAPEVPCGTITSQALEHAGVELGTTSEEANVADVSTRISTGAVDAGFIYSTDAQSLSSTLSSTQDNIIIELDGIQPNNYPMALTTTGRGNAVARAFAEFLTTESAKEILTRYGFGTN